MRRNQDVAQQIHLVQTHLSLGQQPGLLLLEMDRGFHEGAQDYSQVWNEQLSRTWGALFDESIEKVLELGIAGFQLDCASDRLLELNLADGTVGILVPIFDDRRERHPGCNKGFSHLELEIAISAMRAYCMLSHEVRTLSFPNLAQIHELGHILDRRERIFHLCFSQLPCFSDGR